MQVIETVRSAAAVARRRQIIEATIATIAARGYERASFVEIARQAGLSSTRLISYHFDDRAELMAAVAVRVIDDLGAAVGAAVRAAPTPRSAVRAYIDANVAHMSDHRDHLAALTSLLFAGALQVSPEHQSGGTDVLTAIIEDGRRGGDIGDVEPAVAAAVIQRAVEGIPLLLRASPATDLRAHGAQLGSFFDRALAPARGDGTRP